MGVDREGLHVDQPGALQKAAQVQWVHTVDVPVLVLVEAHMLAAQAAERPALQGVHEGGEQPIGQPAHRQEHGQQLVAGRLEPVVVPAGRSLDDDPSAPAEHAAKAGQEVQDGRVLQVLDRVAADRAIEAVALEHAAQLADVARDELAALREAHGFDQLAAAVDHLRQDIDAHAGVPATGQLNGVAADRAAQIEDPLRATLVDVTAQPAVSQRPVVLGPGQGFGVGAQLVLDEGHLLVEDLVGLAIVAVAKQGDHLTRPALRVLGVDVGVDVHLRSRPGKRSGRHIQLPVTTPARQIGPRRRDRPTSRWRS